ncbi:MAG TPA: Stk1 family PASTA domain-containing Ser/Thr kinase [Solirubrobacteraceae bacterium]|jgi:serine/threonine-protein kinase
MVEPGTIIDGRYHVLSRIGSGGMADVYLAADQLLGRQVAVKLLQHRFAEDQEFVERFRREASSAAGLSHPNVVAIFDRGEWNGTYYIAMEYLPGHSLKAIVREQGALDPATATDIVIQILRAAKFAHRHGIIHRDLKPHNVILDEEGRAKVTDFGIALAGASDMTLTGSIMGTAQYLSPEQAQGHTVTATSDLYAVGVVLYELLTGVVPFDGETAVSIALQQISAEPPPPSLLNTAVGPALDAVVLRALAKDPTQRFADAEEFIAALESARQGAPRARALSNGPLASAPGPPPPAPPLGALLLPAAGVGDGEPERDAHRRRWWWAGAAALLLALAAVALVLLLSPSKVTVPNVTGRPQAVAVASLQRAGLTAALSQLASANVAAGVVIGQSPRQGTRVKRGTRVSLLLSSGPGSLPLPAVTGLKSAEAVTRLRAAGLTPTVQARPSSRVAQGVVIATDPTAGTEVQVGSAVTVAVSSGPARVVVPDLTGSTRAAATATLANAGLKVGSVTQQISTSQAPGTVLSQSPAAGTSLNPDQSVDLVLAQASKEVAVPRVVGQNETQAAATLGRAGFEVKSVSAAVSEPEQVGFVLKQSPPGGRMAAKGATVTITVGAAATQTSTTSTTSATSTTGAVPPAANPAPAP